MTKLGLAFGNINTAVKFQLCIELYNYKLYGS